MSKRIAFAHIEFVIDFDSKEEARKYIRENQGKGWNFEPNRTGYTSKPYSFDDEDTWNKWCDEHIFQQDKNNWTVTVRKPYGKYNPGW